MLQMLSKGCLQVLIQAGNGAAAVPLKSSACAGEGMESNSVLGFVSFACGIWEFRQLFTCERLERSAGEILEW